MYKEEIKDIILQLANNFFVIEQNNRLTVNNFTTFINNLVKAFEENVCPPSTST
jgi:hypothetical protein